MPVAVVAKGNGQGSGVFHECHLLSYSRRWRRSFSAGVVWSRLPSGTYKQSAFLMTVMMAVMMAARMVAKLAGQVSLHAASETYMITWSARIYQPTARVIL